MAEIWVWWEFAGRYRVEMVVGAGFAEVGMVEMVGIVEFAGRYRVESVSLWGFWGMFGGDVCENTSIPEGDRTEKGRWEGVGFKTLPHFFEIFGNF